MKQNVTIVGAIEGSQERTVEQQYILMIRSLRKFGGMYADASVVLLQPTENDISTGTLIELGKLGVNFMKHPISPSNTGRGQLNIPYACEHLSNIIKTNHMVWLDCDTIILREPNFISLYDHEVAAHCDMLNYKFFPYTKTQLAYNEDAYAQRYLKEVIMGRPTPDYFRHINTWFVQASPRSKMWTEWAEITRQFVDLVYKHQDKVLSSEFTALSKQGKDKTSLDYALACSQQIGMGLMEARGKYEFREPVGTGHQHISKDVSICHYSDWQLLKKLDKSDWAKGQMKEIENICR